MPSPYEDDNDEDMGVGLAEVEEETSEEDPSDSAELTAEEKAENAREIERKASIAAQILKYEERIEAPEDVKAEMETWEETRRYVHTDAMLLDEEDAVGTNFVLRNQHVAVSLIRPEAPAPRILPRRWMPPPESANKPLQYPPTLLAYAKTHEIIVEFQQRKGGLVDIVNGMIQDAITLPIAWLKMRLQEDFEKDPLGYGRNNDQLDLLKRYQRLKRDFDEGLFDNTCDRYAEMVDAGKTIRAFVLMDMRARMEEESEPMMKDGMPVLDERGEEVRIGAGDLQARIRALLADPEALLEVSDLPEVAHYVGYCWQQVDPEDLRYDWNIRRPEDLRYARWMAHRVWMTPADIREKWGVKDADIENAKRFGDDGNDTPAKRAGNGEDPEYAGKDDSERNREPGSSVEDEDGRGDTLAVWEYWDRVQGRVYRWVQGCDFFLDNFVPVALSSRFFPFFPLIFNRVTGKLTGPSDTDLQRPLQDESNRMRTWQREAQKSAHPRWMVTKGLLRPSEKQRFEQALPYSLTEAERADELAKNIFPIIPPDYNPALYDRSPTVMEMQQMAGIPAAALGAGNVGMTATSDAITNQSMSKQTRERRRAVKALYAAVYEAMIEINAQILPEANVFQIAGVGGVWPEINRQQILTFFVVEAQAVLDDDEERAKQLSAWVNLATIAKQMGLPLDPIPVTKELLELMGIRDNIGRFLSVPALMQSMGVPAVAGAAPAGGPPGSPPGLEAEPTAQGAQGAAGGSPGGGMTAPPAPESIPNSPA